ncbi:MAG: hypothetical protein K2I96_03800 [Lachnospiraceae bacterium]|nr:hypothetical protein [Lachnospiraceae bacterium]
MERCAREKETLFHFKLDEEEIEFNKTTSLAESYFTLYPERDYLMEYSFETAQQLKEKLDVLWENEKYMQVISKTVLVAALKNKPLDMESEKNKVESKQNTNNQMPNYIYNF